MTDLPDWAKDRAREWCFDELGIENPDHVQVASLAALLVEVRAGEYKCPDCGCLTIWAADQYRADVLAEVRRVVEEVRDRWATFHSVGPSVAGEILSRLDAPDPLRVEDLLDGLPRLSTEDEALKAMGSGQTLTKMREYKR